MPNAKCKSEKKNEASSYKNTKKGQTQKKYAAVQHREQKGNTRKDPHARQEAQSD